MATDNREDWKLMQEVASGADEPVVVALASSRWDELRRFGRSCSSTQGVAIALPLRTPGGGSLAGARLQLYVHAGDGRRDPESDAARAERTSLEAQTPMAVARLDKTISSRPRFEKR